MQGLKDCQLKFRLTTDLKEQIAQYSAKRGMNVSEYIRMALEKFIQEEEK